MAVLAVQDLPEDGAPQPTFDPADAAGDEASVGAGHFVVIKNDDLAGITVTFRIPVAVGGVVELVAVPIAAEEEFMLPLPVRNSAPHGGAAVERDPDARATWTYSAVGSITVAALRAP